MLIHTSVLFVCEVKGVSIPIDFLLKLGKNKPLKTFHNQGC